MTDAPIQSHTLRRTRIVCVSDTHNASPLDGAFKLPKGDVLVHAGDLTNQGTFSELERAVRWIEKADFECKIVIAGNHDITLDREFYAQHGAAFHNQHPQSSEACRELLKQAKGITYLDHEAAVIRLTARSGPRTVFRVFGSPYSPASGQWAFGYPPERAAAMWDEIPSDADIIVTHTPPWFWCDMSKDGRAVGCEALRHSLRRVRPRLAVCGHVHEGRGVERVRRTVDGTQQTQTWDDPGRDNKKMSLVDLTGRRGIRLDNDGSIHSANPSLGVSSTTGLIQEQSISTTSGDGSNGPSANTKSLRAACNIASQDMLGGRRETCIVNAAIMASSWPHRPLDSRKYNKPIVVDVDLPVYEYRKAQDNAV